MSHRYLPVQFEKDLRRLGMKPTRTISDSHLNALEKALAKFTEGEQRIVLDEHARAYIRCMHERAIGVPLRAPDFEEVVQGSTWLADPTVPETAAKAFDTSGDISPTGLLCLGEWKSGEIWILDITIPHGYVYVITEDRRILPVFRSISEFAQWAVANELWKRRLLKTEEEIFERLNQLKFFKSVSFLREAGLVPPIFRPKRFKPLYPLPHSLQRLSEAAENENDG